MAINAHIITRAREVDAVLPVISKELELFPFLALDCEWVTNYHNKTRYPVALMQIATRDNVYLFRMHHLDTFSHRKLSLLLSDPHTFKVGVAIDVDVAHLFNDYNIIVRSWLDLRFFSEHLGHHILPPRSLAIMARQLLGIEMDKSRDIACSNWQARKLVPRQIQYAASDVRIPMIILEKVIQQFNRLYGVGQFDSWQTVRRFLHGDLECKFLYHHLALSDISPYHQQNK